MLFPQLCNSLFTLLLPLTKLFFLGVRLTKKRGESCGKVRIMFAIFVERAHTWTPMFLTSVDAAVHKEATVHVSDRSAWRLLKYDFVEDLEGLSRTCTSCKTPGQIANCCFERSPLCLFLARDCQGSACALVHTSLSFVPVPPGACPGQLGLLTAAAAARQDAAALLHVWN